MSIVQVRQIKEYLESTFAGLIDMSDYDGKSDEQRSKAYLSRAVAALAIMHAAGVSADIAAKSIVDGYDDNGIDAIHYDETDRLLYVVQSKWDSDGLGSIELGEAQKFVAGVRDLVHPRFERFNAKVQAKSTEINSALVKDRTKCILIVAYTGNQQLSHHATTALGDLLAELNDTSDVASLMPLSQKELYAAMSSMGESIDLEVMMYEWARVAEPFAAYYGQVKAVDVASWWIKYGVRLLSMNLRNFIGSSDVNDAMVTTLSTAPEKFWYFNNGITVLCANVMKKLAGGSDRASGMFDCKGVSVVNGAQTVGSIAQANTKIPDQLEKARVLVRFISLADCPEGFSTEVTKAANTQNRIELRDFAALDPQQERLRIELLVDEKKTYVYKSGAFSVSPDEGCTVDEAAVALACTHPDVGLTVQAKREVSKLYEDITKPPYKLIFNPSVGARRMWRAVQIQRLVEFNLKDLSKPLDGRGKLVAVHGNRFILYEVFRRLALSQFDDPKLDFEAVKMSCPSVTGDILAKLIAAVDDNYPGSYLNSLFKNAEKCRVLSQDIEDQLNKPKQMKLLQ